MALGNVAVGSNGPCVFLVVVRGHLGSLEGIDTGNEIGDQIEESQDKESDRRELLQLVPRAHRAQFDHRDERCDLAQNVVSRDEGRTWLFPCGLENSNYQYVVVL